MALRRKVNAEYVAAVDPSAGGHVMMLYDDDRTRSAVMLKCINGALEKGQMAVYASVDAGSASHMSKISSKIDGYVESVKKGNLLVVNLSQFYERALAGDLDPFRDLKVIIEEAVRERQAIGRNGEVFIVADCADRLAANEKFDECLNVESWWQETCQEWQKGGLKVTVVCPHPGPMLDKNNERRISLHHSSTAAAKAGRA